MSISKKKFSPQVEFHNKYIVVSLENQILNCYQDDKLQKYYTVSTAKNGPGELSGSECTPRGMHCIHQVIGLSMPINSVFIARKWTGEIYSQDLARQFPNRDWILTRIIQLSGLEPGFNQGGEVDSLHRYIYIHGTPDINPMGIPLSHGCIRMHNSDIIELACWVTIDTKVLIE